MIASYDLWPGDGVVTILVEREGMDERRKQVMRTRKRKKGKVKKSKKCGSEWTRKERGTSAPRRLPKRPCVCM